MSVRLRETEIDKERQRGRERERERHRERGREKETQERDGEEHLHFFQRGKRVRIFNSANEKTHTISITCSVLFRLDFHGFATCIILCGRENHQRCVVVVYNT